MQVRKLLSLNSNGFTLVELMVVVAIIGLLSAVAIPNYKKYQAKSKTTEAKLQLGAIYTAEQSFYAEYGMYSNCLRYMGYDPSDFAPQRYYLTGFPQVTQSIHALAYESATSSGLSSGTLISGGCPNGAANVDGQTFFMPGKRLGNALATEATLPGAQAAGALIIDQSLLSDFYPAAQAGVGSQQVKELMTFRAVASGIIDSDNAAISSTASGRSSSIFSINQSKVIFNPRTGY